MFLVQQNEGFNKKESKAKGPEKKDPRENNSKGSSWKASVLCLGNKTLQSEQKAA